MEALQIFAFGVVVGVFLSAIAFAAWCYYSIVKLGGANEP